MTDSRHPVTVADLRLSARLAHDALERLPEEMWDDPAGTLDWSRRETVAHTIGALSSYYSNLAAQSWERIPVNRFTDIEASKSELLSLLLSSSEILAYVSMGVPPDARGFHSTGHPDIEGYLAMGCAEILLHTYDATLGTEAELRAPDDLSERLLRRLMPWSPADTPGWQTLLWATGRGELEGQQHLGSRWAWHNDPLDEWDGEFKILPPGQTLGGPPPGTR